MTENDFIENLKNKRQDAYGMLIENFQNKVFATCLSFVPNREDAEDIAQEVFIEVFNSIHKFKGDSKLSTWIYKITTNKCLEFIRKRNTKKRFAFLQSITGNGMPLDKTNYFTEMNHPGIQLENKETSETLYYAINKLPETQKVVYTLHKIDCLSYQEISDVIDKSVSSVESLMFRAKNNLKKLLYNYYKNES
ncbi:RNA polymerase sigma factor [Bizionia arctica]|uniref:RNA polymerase sigma factor n=1 Tax=Bizionia arctica TaxID=1495645 RepID=A0A917LVE9_9FLAO|nr:sigma-70 family RNA polymerase sigma factor [Bizionia arctica]GGG59071.1 RNA polymerase sigma factor [Bizionia arctica]